MQSISIGDEVTAPHPNKRDGERFRGTVTHTDQDARMVYVLCDLFGMWVAESNVRRVEPACGT